MNTNKQLKCTCDLKVRTCKNGIYGQSHCTCRKQLDTVDEIVELAKGLIRADTIQESAKATIDFREGVTKALQQEGDRVRNEIKKEITEQTLLNNGEDTFVNLGEALFVCDSKEGRDRFLQNLTKNNHE